MSFKTFDEIIEEHSSPKHNVALELKTGLVQLPADVLPMFKILYRPHGTTKNVGNGEIALYWLLSKKYGGNYEVSRQPGSETADLLVGKVPVELKGWNVDILAGKRIKVGRFEKIHHIRRMINIVFGAYNVFYSGKYSGERYGKGSYLSESSFGVNGLTRAFDCAIKIKDIESKQVDNIRDVLSHKMYEGLEKPEDFAAQTFAALAQEKLLRKIGPGNFIINARPDKIGRIEILQLGDLDQINLDAIKNEGARVQCSELFLNLLAFGKGDAKRG